MNTFDVITLAIVGIGCGIFGLLVGVLIGSGVDRFADYVETDFPLILDEKDKEFLGIDMGSPGSDRHAITEFDHEKRRQEHHYF